MAVDHDAARHLESGACCGAHSHNPNDMHWKAVMNIMAYLHGTRGMSLTFVRGSGLDLTAYSDADYADKSNDRRSVSGTVIPWRVLTSVGQVARRGALRGLQQKQNM